MEVNKAFQALLRKMLTGTALFNVLLINLVLIYN